MTPLEMIDKGIEPNNPKEARSVIEMIAKLRAGIPEDTIHSVFKRNPENGDFLLRPEKELIKGVSNTLDR